MKHIKGKIKTITEYLIMASDDKFNTFEKENFIEKTIYTYNNMNIITQKDNYRIVRGKLLLESSSFFNDRGFLNEQQTYSYVDGTITNKFIMENNEYGTSPRSIFTDNKGVVISEIFYKYDLKGRNIEWKSYNADSTLKTWCEIRYDDFNNEIAFIYYLPNGKVYSITEFIYDLENNPTESKISGIFGEAKQSFVYKNYDLFKNWGQKLTIEKGTICSIIEREYEYFA